MFRQLADYMTNTTGVTTEEQAKEQANAVFKIHPGALKEYLRAAWAHRQNHAIWPTPFNTNDMSTRYLDTVLGNSIKENDITAELCVMMGVDTNSSNLNHPLKVALEFKHLIYALMIEHTNAIDILRKVVHDYRHGEKLGTPSIDAQYWLNAAEGLLFSNPSLLTLHSEIRPDFGATRRNAYWRMFGFELPHGKPDGKDYPFVKADMNNGGFVESLESLLHELWVLYSYHNATTGNLSDKQAAFGHLTKLKDMLSSRRKGGNLYVEEFYSVATMDFVHLTLNSDTAIVASLNCEASSPGERLAKIADRVGVPVHSRAENYFNLSDPLSKLLVDIERNTVYTSASDLHPLYDSTSSATDDMLTILNNWSAVTGRNLKEKRPNASNVATFPAQSGSGQLQAVG